VRIVGGDLKGRSLTTPKGSATRPTSDRAREALFNILAHANWGRDLDGIRVIDLFAGSGALGFEALSRGASWCLFVETEAAARGAIRENIEQLSLFGQTRIHRRDATSLGKRATNIGEAFNLALIDPPYGRGLGEKALSGLVYGNWVEDDAIAMLEVGSDEDPDTPGWDRLDVREYGAAKVLFLKRA
jgi:16S rRNA (guanine966-N2)-methyltransferase